MLSPAKFPLSPKKQEFILKEISFHPGVICCTSQSADLYEDNVEDADETHILNKMDHGRNKDSGERGMLSGETLGVEEKP